MVQNSSTPIGMRSSRQARELARRLGKLTEAQAALGWAIILVLAAVLGAIYLNQASRIATVGRRIQIKQLELEEIKRENSDLERNIAEAQSLERLQQRALQLGFQAAEGAEIEYIVIPDYPAATTAPPLTLQEPSETSATPTPVPIETMGDAISRHLTNSLQALIRGESREQ